MYGVIRRYQFDQNKSEQLNRKVREAFVPLLKKIPGFVAYYWLDTGEGSGASLSVFENKSGADESVRLAGTFVREHPSDPVTKYLMRLLLTFSVNGPRWGRLEANLPRTPPCCGTGFEFRTRRPYVPPQGANFLEKGAQQQAGALKPNCLTRAPVPRLV